MAHSNDSVITGKFRGKLGKELVFRDWDGKTVVAKAPKARKTKPSSAQAQISEKFFLASKYAKAIAKGDDQGIKEAYSAVLRPRQNLYSRAVEDFMTSPTVRTLGTTDYTGAIGSKISIRAVDDFRITRVRLEIYAANGTLLEKGNALQENNGVDWTYTATQVNNLLAGSTIKAIATDVPGNEGTLEVIL